MEDAPYNRKYLLIRRGDYRRGVPKTNPKAAELHTDILGTSRGAFGLRSPNQRSLRSFGRSLNIARTFPGRSPDIILRTLDAVHVFPCMGPYEVI